MVASVQISLAGVCSVASIYFVSYNFKYVFHIILNMTLNDWSEVLEPYLAC